MPELQMRNYKGDKWLLHPLLHQTHNNQTEGGEDMKTKLTWLLLRMLSNLLNVEDECTIILFERDRTVTLKEASKNKVTKQFN